VTAILDQSAGPTRVSTKPPMPREHGAWGILLIPFATAVGIAGTWNLQVALLLISMVCFYVARTSFLKHDTKWILSLLAVSVACLAPLLGIWHLWWLAVFGVAAAPLAIRKTQRGVVSQLVAVAGLTLTAPAAWYAATGSLDRQAWLLWGLNFLYFAGGVFYVKMHVAAALRRKRFGTAAEKIECGAANLTFYSGLTICVVGLAMAHLIPWLATLAFAPVIVRAVAGVGRLSPTLLIKRLGWTEVAHSIVFAALLIFAEWRT
jgi:hypothetical protein